MQNIQKRSEQNFLIVHTSYTAAEKQLCSSRGTELFRPVSVTMPGRENINNDCIWKFDFSSLSRYIERDHTYIWITAQLIREDATVADMAHTPAI